MGYIKYNDFVIPETYFNAFLARYRSKYIAKYFGENGTYPSIDDIAKINIPESELTNIKHKCYINYLVREADRIDGDIVVPEIPDESQNEVTVNNISGCWKLVTYEGDLINTYIQYIRTDKTFILYQNINSSGWRKYTGMFNLYQLGNDVILEGIYSDGTPWGTEHCVSLTANTLKLISKIDENTFEVQEYIRVDEIPYDVIFSVSQSPLIKPWIELPNMDDDSLEYYDHSFEYNQYTYRNYSFGWSQNDRISKWVAYPLDKTYMNHNVDRTNAWAIDPLLGEEKSSAPFSGYAGDYARGNLIASADRLCCELANEQVFYGSNVFPQSNEHNEGIWAIIESRIRSVADYSDCTYVLKGLITSENSIIETDSNGNNVTVPDAIYAVILRQSNGSTFGEWNACAFYTEHKEYTDYDLTQVIMSVSDLESITGMKYFVALKDIVGEEQYNTIKSTLNTKIFV